MTVRAAQNNNLDEAISVLSARFGDRVATGQSIREQHAHQLTYLPCEPPDAVVYAETTQDVAEIVKICAAHNIPIIPFGAGTSLEGQLNAPQGGISVDLSRLDKVIAVHPEDMDCVIQAGITRKALNEYLRDTGLFFSVDPGADATLGGMAATGASGTTAVKYGTMRTNILNMTVVMADGVIVQTAKRARKSAAGYDLTRLMIGSEGTLGIITELTLKLHGVPEAISAAVCPFKTVDDACSTVATAMQMGLSPARMEFLDALQIKACNAYSKLTLEETPTLFLEFHGSTNAVREAAQAFADLAHEHSGGPMEWTDKPQARKTLWAARHNAYWAAVALKPGTDIFVTDVCVPLSNLAQCVHETREDIQDAGLLAPIVGHVGDGNFHVLALIDADNPAETKAMDDFVQRLIERALKMEGTCSGEHGIGQGKRRFLRSEHGAGVDVMRAIKTALDPQNLLNPGKIFEVPDAR